jgi:hypothetical protein
MARRNPIAWVLIFGTSFSTYGADTNELKERRVRAADAFSKGILLVHARPSLDDAADGFRQDPIFSTSPALKTRPVQSLPSTGNPARAGCFYPLTRTLRYRRKACPVQTLSNVQGLSTWPTGPSCKASWQ